MDYVLVLACAPSIHLADLKGERVRVSADGRRPARPQHPNFRVPREPSRSRSLVVWRVTAGLSFGRLLVARQKRKRFGRCRRRPAGAPRVTDRAGSVPACRCPNEDSRWRTAADGRPASRSCGRGAAGPAARRAVGGEADALVHVIGRRALHPRRVETHAAPRLSIRQSNGRTQLKPYSTNSTRRLGKRSRTPLKTRLTRFASPTYDSETWRSMKDSGQSPATTRTPR